MPIPPNGLASGLPPFLVPVVMRVASLQDIFDLLMATGPRIMAYNVPDNKKIKKL